MDKFKIVKIHVSHIKQHKYSPYLFNMSDVQDRWYYAIRKKVWWGWRYVYSVLGEIEAKTGVFYAKVVIFKTEDDAKNLIENLKYENSFSLY
jgi:hypothetical protein